MKLTLLNLETPPMSASGDPQTSSVSDIKAMQDLFMTVHTMSGEFVTPEKAKRCAAVLACMRGISEDLSALPLVLYKRGKLGDDRAIDHPLYSILESSPNEVMTSFELREHIIFDLMLHGGFYVLRNEDDAGEITSLWPLSAAYVSRRALQLVWNYMDPLTNIGGEFTADTVWRGTIMSTNALDGVSLTLLAREAIGLLLAAEKQAGRLFAHGIQTDFTLNLPEGETLDKDQKDQLRNQLMQRHGGAYNAHMPLILEGGMTAAKLGLTAQESQYIEARQYQTEDVARIFRYPEVLLGAGAKGKAPTYASAEQFFQAYVKHTLTPWAVRIEQTISRDLLSGTERKKYYARHDFDQLLRGDTAARYGAYEKAIQAGIMSPEEARKKEGLPYAEGLNFFLQPLTFKQVAGADAVIDPAQSDIPNTGEGDGPSGLALRVATHIFKKEHKALTGNQKDADSFYAHFAGYVEDITGADLDAVLAYLEMRRTTEDRFSKESRERAITALTLLCKKDN